MKQLHKTYSSSATPPSELLFLRERNILPPRHSNWRPASQTSTCQFPHILPPISYQSCHRHLPISSLSLPISPSVMLPQFSIHHHLLGADAPYLVSIFFNLILYWAVRECLTGGFLCAVSSLSWALCSLLVPVRGERSRQAAPRMETKRWDDLIGFPSLAFPFGERDYLRPSFYMDRLLALWPLLLLASLVTCKVWSLDLYLKKLPCFTVYILLQNSIRHPCSTRDLGPRVLLSLSLSLYFWLIPWNVKAGCVTQGILASFLLSFSYHELQTTRFQSIKGPQHWTITDLQYCVSSKHTEKWFSYTFYMHLFFFNLFPFRILQNIVQNSLCYRVSLLVFYFKYSSVNPKLPIYLSPQLILTPGNHKFLFFF